MQGPGHPAREVLVVQDGRLQLEHEQQDDPGSGIDGRRKRLGVVAENESAREAVRHGCPLLGEKDKDVGGQKRVDGVLEKLVDTPAVGSQSKPFPVQRRQSILPVLACSAHSCSRL